ncbi:MAG: hypothetical protein ACJAYU_004613 [Bradymonadia bacterium]
MESDSNIEALTWASTVDSFVVCGAAVGGGERSVCVAGPPGIGIAPLTTDVRAARISVALWKRRDATFSVTL